MLPCHVPTSLLIPLCTRLCVPLPHPGDRAAAQHAARLPLPHVGQHRLPADQRHQRAHPAGVRGLPEPPGQPRVADQHAVAALLLDCHRASAQGAGRRRPRHRRHPRLHHLGQPGAGGPGAGRGGQARGAAAGAHAHRLRDVHALRTGAAALPTRGSDYACCKAGFLLHHCRHMLLLYSRPGTARRSLV